MDPKDHPALLEKRVALERKVPWVLLAVMASKALLVFLVLLVLRVPLERMVTREKLADPDRREAKETRVNLVHQAQAVFREWLELLVQLAAMARLDREGSRVCLARKETKAPEDSLVCQDPSDCRVYLALPARRERMETSDRWVHLVLLAPEVLRVPAELAVLKVLPVVSVQWEVLVRREKAVKQATQDHLESLVLGDPEERLVRREKPAHPELLDLPVHADPPEMTVPRATPVLLASQETPVPLVSLVLVVLMVYQVTKEMMEMPDSLALQVHLARLEYQDLRAKGDLLDQQVRRADKERRDPRERLEPRGLLVKLVLWDLRVLLERVVPRDCVESLALWVSKDSLDLLVKTALLDLSDLLDFPV